MKYRKQSSYFEKYHIFIMDIFDEEIQKFNNKNKKINFSILATRINKSVKQTKRLFKSYVNDPIKQKEDNKQSSKSLNSKTNNKKDNNIKS